MAPVFLPVETSLNLNVLISGLTLGELIRGLLGASFISALLQVLSSVIPAALNQGSSPL